VLLHAARVLLRLVWFGLYPVLIAGGSSLNLEAYYAPSGALQSHVFLQN
jgi:hypothetical protein